MGLFRKNFSVYSSIEVIAAVILLILMTGDSGTTAALCWLAVVFCVSFFMRPFLLTKNLKFLDRGMGLSFGLGLFLCFYVCWTFCAITGCDYSDVTVHASFAVMAVLGLVIKKYCLKEEYITREELRQHLNGFAVFAVVFFAFFWMIGFNPNVDPGTENYMDFGFMQTIYRQKSAIPFDPWFSGTKLNYYYLGQSAAVYICRLAHTTPEFGYNLTLCTFIGMAFLMVYELCAAIAGILLPDFSKKTLTVRLGAILGGSVAAFAGNPHWLLYGFVGKILSKVLGNDDYSYWFSDGTVYISTANGDPDNGKNEFPAYSVILGDLHAHVMNVIFVLPLLALLFDLCLSEKEDENKKSVVSRLILISMLLGYYKGSNYWDFAIYYVITGALIVFTDLTRRGLTLKTAAVIGSKAVVVTAVSIISILPFTLNFIKMESGIEICDVHSPIVKLAVLWLIPVAVSIYVIIFLYFGRGKKAVANRAAKAGLLAFILCSIGLVITPEILYVKDIYGDLNARFNTMFKLTYQAFLLFALITGVAFSICLFRTFSEEKRTKAFVVIFAFIAVLAVSYTPYSAYRWLGRFWDKDQRKGISSIEGLYEDDFYRFEMECYDRLMEDDSRVLNIVEVAGDSYSHQSALSIYTGACTPVGWFVHEWMWHNDPEIVKNRADEVIRFYTSGDSQYCRQFLKKYDIDYIVVGPAEVCKYPVNRTGFYDLGDAKMSQIWQNVELALIKVDRSKL